jgi:ligand-binding SRPBCC domain-containing protein
MLPVRFRHTTELDASANALWEFHASPGALERLSPPLGGMRVVDPGDGVAEGSLVKLEVGAGPWRRRWHALHVAVRPGESFVDVALEGPFRFWVHLHRFEPVGHDRSRLVDQVWYLPPAGVPRWLGRPLFNLLLRLLFTWRHRRTRRAVERTGASWNGPALGAETA